MQIKASRLEDILTARENREKKRISLTSEYRLPIISFTLNIPGPVKDKPLYRKVFNEGVEVITLAVGENNIPYQEVVYLTTGPEAYICIDMKASEIKAKAVEIEENHPLGRLFDYDVFDCSLGKLSRYELHLSERRCLICEEKAALCARSKKHDIEKLIENIEGIANSYFLSQK